MAMSGNCTKTRISSGLFQKRNRRAQASANAISAHSVHIKRTLLGDTYWLKIRIIRKSQKNGRYLLSASFLPVRRKHDGYADRVLGRLIGRCGSLSGIDPVRIVGLE